MHSTKIRTYIIVAISFLASCTTDNSYRAVLLDQSDPKSTERYDSIYDAQGRYISGNPINIGNDTRFSIVIDAISPGWLLQQSAARKILQSNESSNQPSVLAPRDHFKDKELWVLTKISSVSSADIMETQSKQYFKASNVKFETEAFSLIPLDEAEKVIFTHLSDSAYRISFEVFEIDGFEIKQEIQRAGQNPGISQILIDGFNTTKNILGATLGDYVTSRLKEAVGQPGALERLLLELGATREFSGQVMVHRSDKPYSELYDGPYNSRNFFLVDWFKSGKATPPKESILADETNHLISLEEYRNACVVNTAQSETDTCMSISDSKLSYVQFRVDESPSNFAFTSEQLSDIALEQSRMELVETITTTRNDIRALLFDTEDGTQNAYDSLTDLLQRASASPSISTNWARLADLEQVGNGIADHVAAMLAISNQLNSVSLLGELTEDEAVSNNLSAVHAKLSIVKPRLIEFQKLTELMSFEQRADLRRHILRPLD